MLAGYNYIAVEGAIGAGKTSLATLLARELNAQLLLEEFEDNVFLPKFYQDKLRFAFPVELAFLAQRYKQLKRQNPIPNLFDQATVSDYFLAKSLIFAQINLSEPEYNLFKDLFDIMFHTTPKPDLLIYLHMPLARLTEQIKTRGRVYENNIDPIYLNALQDQYMNYLKQNLRESTVWILDVSERDFVHKKDDFTHILNLLKKPVSKGIHHEVV